MPGIVAFTGARDPVQPHSSYIVVFVGDLLIYMVCIDALLDSEVVLYVYKAFFECFSRSHGNEFHVLPGPVSLLVYSGWTNPKCPRAIYPGVFLVAIFRCSVILLDRLIMGAFAMNF